MLSAFLGITLGDNFWLLALKSIGARRVILVDAIKPFLAALIAWPLFGEAISYLTVIGMIVCSAGILYVSLEKSGAGHASVASHLDQATATNKEKSDTPISCGTALHNALKSSPCRQCEYVQQAPQHKLVKEAAEAETEQQSVEETRETDIQLTLMPVHESTDAVQRQEQIAAHVVNAKVSVSVNDSNKSISNDEDIDVTCRGHIEAKDADSSTISIERPSETKTRTDAAPMTDPSVEQTDQQKSTCSGRCSKRLALGYVWAALNVALDVGGAALTKYYGTELNTWEIGTIRFGSASLTLLLVRLMFIVFTASARPVV